MVGWAEMLGTASVFAWGIFERQCVCVFGLPILSRIYPKYVKDKTNEKSTKAF